MITWTVAKSQSPIMLGIHLAIDVYLDIKWAKKYIFRTISLPENEFIKYMDELEDKK